MPKEFRFDDRVAVITGAGRGLGRAHALLLASRGAQIVVNDLGSSLYGEGAEIDPADEVVNEIKARGGEAVPNYDSVTDGEKIIQAALDHFGKVDILINNAGILRDVTFAKMQAEDWDEVLNVHLNGAFKVTHAAWQHMRRYEFGRIIMTSSSSGIYGNYGQSNYAAAKLALVGLANTLALEGKKYNICANAIAPVAGSRMTLTMLPPDIVEALKPEYVSPLVAYLCHEETHETGGLYEVGAGWVAKVRWERTHGAAFPLDAPITPENIAAEWASITDWTNPDHPTSAHDSLATLLANLKSAFSGD